MSGMVFVIVEVCADYGGVNYVRLMFRSGP